MTLGVTTSVCGIERRLNHKTNTKVTLYFEISILV